jgi:hypothetical protein
MTQEELHQLLDYDASSGELRWRESGRVTGTVNKSGYKVVNIRKHGGVFLAHRLVWLWVHGEWPPNHTDHINGVKTDNRLVNLRLATASENVANQGVRSKSGFKGVWKHGRGWAASIRKDRATHHLGTFDTPELAHAAYCEAAKSMHGEFARSA